ncbi:MAG: triose-phosphate isomerase [Deltaproteobacteria bacterium]|nr:triose-phosphate isomerase [Deltaproteobacteria bacterium]
MTRTPLIVANWKMNHGLDETIKFVAEISRSTLPDKVEVVLCPPYTSLHTLSVALGEGATIKAGAQNCHFEIKGAYTGEVSVEFLKELSCEYVIIGHSERRQYFKEDNKFLNKKLHCAIEAKLIPIYCIGELESERESGDTFNVIARQMQEGLAGLAKDQIGEMVFAYEPVWAIGTGKTATPEIAQEVHAFIRKWIATNFGTLYAELPRILYGGSVTPDNAGALIAQRDIDGALVGGASLSASNFLKIISVCR